MSCRPWARKALATLAGLAFALALAEGTLALVARWKRVAAADPGDAGFTILCVGNSYTKGDGAPTGYSYPELLENQLRASRPDLRARVVNAGVSLGTTSVLLERLPEQLRAYRPDVVTFMAGDANFFFTYGFAEFQARHGAEGPVARARRAAERFLLGFRVVRWLVFLRGGFYEPPYLGWDAPHWLAFLEDVTYNPLWLDADRLRRAYAVLQAFFTEHPDDKQLAIALLQLSSQVRDDRWDHWLDEVQRIAPNDFLVGPYAHTLARIEDPRTPEMRREHLRRALARLRRNYPGDRDFREIQESELFAHFQSKPRLPARLKGRERCDWIERLLAVNALNVPHYETLAYCLLDLGEEDRAVDVMFRAARRNPYSQHDAAGFLTQMKEASKDPAVVSRIASFLDEYFRTYPELRYEGFTRTTPERTAWMRSELRTLIDLARASGAAVVVQAYPPLRNGIERVTDRILPELARENGVPFSDTRAELLGRFRTEAEKESYYSNEFGPADHHLNARGNTAVAGLLYRTLRENRLLPRAGAR